MDCIGLSPAEKSDLFRVVAAVLHLGNVKFEENTSDKKGNVHVLFFYILSLSSPDLQVETLALS